MFLVSRRIFLPLGDLEDTTFCDACIMILVLLFLGDAYIRDDCTYDTSCIQDIPKLSTYCSKILLIVESLLPSTICCPSGSPQQCRSNRIRLNTVERLGVGTGYGVSTRHPAPGFRVGKLSSSERTCC